MTKSNQSNGDVEKLVEQYWSRRADSFDGDSQHGIHSDEQRDAWLSILHKWVGDKPGEILDAGCGTGVISILLSELGHKVTGIDLSPKMLNRAREKVQESNKDIDFYEGNVENLSFDNNTYDIVTARHLIWTLPNPSKAVREWSRIARPDGYIVLIEGHWDFDAPWDEYREIHEELPLYQGPKPKELTELLEEQGLQQVKYESLSDPVLWGQKIDYETYIVQGTISE